MNMKKIISVILVLCTVFALAGCSKIYKNNDEMLEKVRKEMPVSDPDKAEIHNIGTISNGDNELFWYAAGNKNQPYKFFAVEFLSNGAVGDMAEYKYKKTYEPQKVGKSLYVLEWNDGYSFCINNPECKKVRVSYSDGTSREEIIDSSNYPYVFFEQTIPESYAFLDKDGNEIK